MKQVRYFVVALVALLVLLLPNALRAADFNANNLISDSDFVNINAMSVDRVQNFLNSRGSCLAGFSENGRSAAQVIYDAAHGYGEASGSINGININTSTGTVNPGVILATLQKEQSLISDPGRCTANVLVKAMGYGCPDAGGCNPKYAGFTKQVEWASWQLRYNYERAQGTGFSDYQVGQGFCWNDWNGTHCGTFDNRATAALYRYTPHVYNGNYNFWNLFHNIYRFYLVDYYGTHAGQSGYVNIFPGNKATLEVKFTNTGGATWYAGGGTPVSLALDRHWASSTVWQDSSWLSSNRIVRASEGDIAPGQIGTYSFQIYCPPGLAPGQYRFYVRLVADGITWFDNPDINGGAWWQINVPRPQATFVGQSAHSINAWPGEVINMSAAFMNTGSGAWTQGSPPMNLAIDKYQNEAFLSRFSHNWLSPNRIKTLPSPSVAPGQVADFFFQARVPTDLAPGSYRFYVRLVQDGFAWCEPGNNGSAWWQINVPKPTAQHISQSPGPTISRGETTQLSVTFKNTSSVTWKADSLTPVSLAIDKYWASETAWQGEGWLSKNRITSANNIAPGENATFTFNIAVPHTMPSGKHRFYVRLVADNYSWFDNPDINGAAWWEITVP
ncbi:MAG TPA: hypothetical protein PLC05_01190 [bacterium]|nr:hypothetical protein [bacterium]HOR57516.1 hypothetical protein [bacterium]HPL56101.1 hypothetical protein [bacterium]